MTQLMAMMGFEPDRTIDIMMLINAKQLQIMSEKLLLMFPKQTTNGKRIEKALGLLQQLKVAEAAVIIEDITMHQDLPADKKQAMTQLVQEARAFGEETLDELRNGVIPEYILQVPSLSK